MGKKQYKMGEATTDQLDGIMNPLAYDILFAWFFEAHEQMVDARLFTERNFVCDYIQSGIYLHRICVDYSTTLEAGAVSCEL